MVKTRIGGQFEQLRGDSYLVLDGIKKEEYPELKCELFGREFKNPIGLAAGFDKDSQAITQLAKNSGFGFIEIGSVTPIPQPGNNRPRVFRLLEDEGVINRHGFNSDGVGRVHQRVRSARDSWVPEEYAYFGVNLGKNKLTEDVKLTNGQIPIIGCGGVFSGEDAYEKIRAGASLVQLYSAFVYEGFPVIGKIKRELAELLKRDGFNHKSDSVGADHRPKQQ